MTLLDKDGNEIVAHIPLEQFRIMQHDLMFLTCLQAAGVDNWDGYDEAIDLHKKMKEETTNAKRNEEEDCKDEPAKHGSIILTE